MRSRPARLRVSRLQDQAGKAIKLPESKIRSGASPGRCTRTLAKSRSNRFHGPGAAAYQAARALADQGADRELNPLLRGWGDHYKRAHVRKLFHQLDRWIVRRIWSHRFKRWRNRGWRQLPEAKLYGEYGLVNLGSVNSFACISEARVFVKAAYGKTVRAV